MAYAPITAKVAGDVLTAAYINTYYKGNIEHLLNGKQVQKLRYTKTSNYTTTSTSWSDVDATNLKLTLTSNFITGRCKFEATFWASLTFSGGSAPYTIFFDLYDATDSKYISSGTSTPLTGGMVSWGLGAGQKVLFGSLNSPNWTVLSGELTGMTAGTHDIKLRWKLDNASATGTIYADVNPQVYMSATEF